MLLQRGRRTASGSGLLILLSVVVGCMLLLALGASSMLLFFTFPGESKPQALKPINEQGLFNPDPGNPPPQGPTQPGPGPKIGQVAPDIVGKDIDGVEFKLSDYRGKVVVLDFWGHW